VSLRDETNENLLQRYQAADPKAFEEFFRRHRKLVFNYLLARLRNHAEAEEVLQDTFLRVHKYVLRYDPEKNALAWLMTVARNAMLNKFAKRHVTEPLHEELCGGVGDASAATEARQTVERLLLDLSPVDRELIKARFVEDESYEEIAKSHGLSEANARQKISRLLRKVRASGQN
jgi:RNA polymerase sigma-70 factor (ECF subfamily)